MGRGERCCLHRRRPTHGPCLEVLAPAFTTSELRCGFEIGFLIVAPFLAIDVAVKILTISMAMMTPPPTTTALSAKVLFFILIDAWRLLVGAWRSSG